MDWDSGSLDRGFVTLEETPGDACLVATPRNWYWYLGAARMLMFQGRI